MDREAAAIAKDRERARKAEDRTAGVDDKLKKLRDQVSTLQEGVSQVGSERNLFVPRCHTRGHFPSESRMNVVAAFKFIATPMNISTSQGRALFAPDGLTTKVR